MVCTAKTGKFLFALQQQGERWTPPFPWLLRGLRGEWAKSRDELFD